VVAVSANGSFSADLSGLGDGTVSSVLAITDDAGNTASANGAAIDLDTNADVGADLTLTIDAANLITNDAHSRAVGFTVSGLDADASGTVTFSSTGGGSPVVVAVSANGSFSAALSGPGDGTVSSVLAITDDAGNTASANGAAIDLDTNADVGADLTLTIDAANLITNDAESSAGGFTVSGLDADASGTVTFTSTGGGSPVVVAVSANGSFSADLSGLGDGTVSSVLAITDDAGNTASANGAAIDLDTH